MLRSFTSLLLIAFALPAAGRADVVARPTPAAPAASAAQPAQPAQTRTVYRCVAGGTVSLATAPEPGSRCKAITFDANAAKLPDLWRVTGAQKGVLYEYTADGRTYLSTRKRPG